MGIVLLEIITYGLWQFLLPTDQHQGATPYGGMLDSEVFDKVTKEAYKIPKPKNCPPKFYELICW
jgi:hypothetical protein